MFEITKYVINIKKADTQIIENLDCKLLYTKRSNYLQIKKSVKSKTTFFLILVKEDSFLDENYLQNKHI
jgi:hypothetical protein